MRARLIKESKRLVRTQNRKTGKRILLTETISAGTLIEGPKVWLLCLQGQAIPADKECEEKCGMTAEQMEAASKAYDLVSGGIDPEDYAAFEQGLMRGYKPEGIEGDTWQPGPNWQPGCEAEYYSEIDEDDDDE